MKGHLQFPKPHYSFEGDRVNQSLGPNIPLSTNVMRSLFDLGLVHALITRRRDYSNTYPSQEIWHRFTVLLDGHMTIEINGTTHDVLPGDLVYTPSGTLFFQSNPGNSWYLYLTFSEHPSWARLKKHGAYVRPYESADLMYLLMERIATAYENPTTTVLQFAERDAQLLADLVKREVTLTEHRPRRHGVALKRLVEEIKQAPDVHWTIASMAAATCVSARTLNRIFVAEYGISPIDLVVRERMSRAYGLIAETDMTIAMIAQAVGYESVASFSRLFKKQFGMSPGKCRPDIGKET